MDCFWFIIVHFSFPCNTKCIVVSVTLTAFLFYSLFPPMFTYIKSLTQHLPSLPSLPSCLCLLLFLSLWLHMVQSCMSEQQTARRQQSARAGSCASPNYPFNKAWASSTKIFPYSSLQHSFFFSPLSLRFVPCYILSPFARLTGTGVQRRLRQPPPPRSAGWVLSSFFFSPSLHLILPLLPASYSSSSSSSSSCG